VLQRLCIDLKFTHEFIDILDRENFFRQNHRIIFNQIIKIYHSRDDTEISLADLSMMIDEYSVVKSIDSMTLDSLREELEAIYRIKTGDPVILRDHLINALKRARVTLALKNSIDIATNDGDLDSIPKLLETALQISFDEDEHSGKDLINLPWIYREMYGAKNLVPTGIPTLDKNLNGGYGPGEVHVIVGRPKSGKSTIGPLIGVNSLLRGKKVFHISLEINTTEVLTKYGCILTGWSYNNIANAYSNSGYSAAIDPYVPLTENLFVKYFTEGTATVQDIKAWILKEKNRYDHTPDLIIVDYDDCLVSSRRFKNDNGGESMYGESGQIYTDLKLLADYFKCPLLTFSQVNRAGWGQAGKKGLITADHIAHSARKCHRATSIASINFASNEDEGVLFLDMCRRGQSKVKIPMKRDLGKCLFWEEYNSTADKYDEISD